jgi:hypothetical protein
METIDWQARAVAAETAIERCLTTASSGAGNEAALVTLLESTKTIDLTAAADALESTAALAQQVATMREALEEAFPFQWVSGTSANGGMKQVRRSNLCEIIPPKAEAAIALPITAAEQQARENASKAAQWNLITTDPAAAHIAVLRGTIPLTKAQLIHAAGLDADVAERAELLDWLNERRPSLAFGRSDNEHEFPRGSWGIYWTNKDGQCESVEAEQLDEALRAAKQAAKEDSREGK